MALSPLEKREQLIRMFGAYSVRLEQIFDDYYNRLARLGLTEEVLPLLADDSALFSFGRVPEVKSQLDNIFDDFVQRQMGLYRTGITDGAILAIEHDTSLLGGYSVLSETALKTIRNNAVQGFLRGRLTSSRGLSLSQLVWNYASQAKSEFEVAITNVITQGLQEGTSAEELGRKVREQLNNPDMMYRRYHEKVVMSDGTKKDVAVWRRRVIDEDGKVRFVKEPLEKVGMGHYRSARKNALRLMRTEINASYHNANYERWQQEPFVIGIRIFLSPQHPEEDECDYLAGNYPKDFYWTGWHPQCYSDDTKVLTDAGWKLFADVSDNDRILSLNPETRAIEYAGIKDRQKWWKEGTMIRFIGPGIDCQVTSEHRMVYLGRESMRIEYCTAEDFDRKKGAFIVREDAMLFTSWFTKEHVYYSGYVYDLTLERNHIMYVQRNGRCFWGSNCMCASAPITLQGEEKKDYYRRVALGEDMSDYVSPNAITDVPDGYKEWVAANAERIRRADARGKLAWHLEDNREYWEGIVNGDVVVSSNDAGDDVAVARAKYDSYDDNWIKAHFNDENGGFNVYHREHLFSDNKNKEARYSGGEAEKVVGRLLADNHAKQIEYLPEKGFNGKKADLSFDDSTWDIKYIPVANVETIRKYIKNGQKADNIIFFWDENSRLQDLNRAVDRTAGALRAKGKLDLMPGIYYIDEDNSMKRLY